jgi:hypothetical protein
MSKDYWFFLSYARNDAQGDPWLREFYERLARDVSRAAGLSSGLKPEDIGFIDDKGIESGTQWTQELAEALQSSRVFVCLFSRSYFNSEWCGKEFQVFRDRVQAYVDAHPGLKWPPLILPVLWDRPDKLPKPFPKIVEDLRLQYVEAAFGQMYAQEGLYYIIRMGEEKEYQRFLLEFRECIVRAAMAYPLPGPGQSQPWAGVANPFRPQTRTVPPPVSVLAAIPSPLQGGRSPEAITPIRAFLCHSSADKPTIRELYQRLRKDGIQPWLDEEDLLPGQDWRKEIPKAVRAADVIIVCLSSLSVKKDGYLNKEIADALIVAEEKTEGTIFIIPVRLEPVDVPERLSQWQWANLFEPGGYERLLRALRARAEALRRRGTNY